MPIKENQINLLKKILANKISTIAEDLKKHSGNQFYSESCLPDAVCYAESEKDIIALTNFCVKYQIPIIPYGSGTSVEGHLTPVLGGISLDLSKMNKIITFQPKDYLIVVEPGISYNKLNEFLEPHGFHFPVEAGFGASIGGMVATNASGAGATDSGSMAQNILGCSVISYKNEEAYKITTGSHSLKSSAGYNMTALFAGSEGTLGIITEISLKIRKNLPCNFTICTQFDDISSAIDFVIATKGIIRFRRVELLDKLQTEMCIQFSNIDILDKNKNTILIELFGSYAVIEDEAKIINMNIKKFGGSNFQIYRDKQSAEFIWKMRKNACPAVLSCSSKSKKAMATDACVPLSKLSECINSCYVEMKKLGINAPLVAHVGDGNFHFTLTVDPSDKGEFAKNLAFNKFIVNEALKFKGTCTGEHGIGFGKKSYLETQYKDSLFLMKQIKKTLDPLNIFNPGKIINMENKNDHDCYNSTNCSDTSYSEPKIRAKI